MKSLALPMIDDAKADIFGYLARGLVLLGILLRSIQLLINRGLREDEGHLAINFVTRDLIGVLKPLDNGQIAPPLFLIIEKIAMTVFGQNEFALRGFAFLSSCLALILFYKFLKSHTNQWVTIMGVAMMAINRSLIFFAVAVKQYSSDVLINVFVFYWLFNKDISDLKKYRWLGPFGAIAIWLSHTSTFILFCVGIYLLLRIPKSSSSERIAILLSGTLWAVSFGLLYVTSISHHPNQTIMMNYWAGHFMPLAPQTSQEWLWYVNHLKFMVAYCFGFSPKHFVLWVPYAIAFFTGIFYCVKRREQRYLLWILTPIGIHLLASGFNVYPFYHRLILYLTFQVFVFASFGIYVVVQRVQMLFLWPVVMRVGIAFLIAIILIVNLIDFPFPTEDIKKSLAVVKQHFQSGDKVFVYYPIDACFDFYREKYIPASTPVVYSTASREDYGGYKQQIAPLTGRVWFVFSHLYTNPSGIPEDLYIVSLAAKRGHTLMQEHSYYASVYLVEMRPSPLTSTESQ